MAGETVQTQLAERYATALFELATQSGCVEAVCADLASLRRSLQTSADLNRFMRSPVFDAHEHARALKIILAKMEATRLTEKFVLLLASKRRLFASSDIIGAFERLVARSRGQIEAQVTAARDLRDSEIEQLKAVLVARLGKEPRLHIRVDPQLLGGLIVKVGSRMIDSSIRTKLEGLRAAMKGS